MTSHHVVDASLDVYYAATEDSDTPDATITEINSVKIDARVDDWMDEASISCWHPSSGLAIRTESGAYSTSPYGEMYDGEDTLEYDLSVGDMIVFNVEVIDGNDQLSTISWTGRVQPTEHKRDQLGRADASLDASATDYVGDILSDRKVTRTWINKDVGKVIRDVVQRKANEVDASNVPDLGVTTDVFFDQRDCWDGVMTLANRADSIVYAVGNQLHVQPISGLSLDFKLTREDYALPWSTHTSDDLKNVVRVDSGVTRQEEDAQETQTGWHRVTASDRLLVQLTARKSTIHSIDLYVDQVADNEDLRIRLQADDGGTPIEVGNTESDIDMSEWGADELPTQGWHTFFFSDHKLPDRNPWLIIESEGDTGHDVGINDTGVPTYVSYYPHPVNFEVSSQDSIEQFGGARETSLQKQNLATLTAARDAARGELAKRAFPPKTVAFSAESPRAHLLEPGDMFTVDEKQEDAVGEFVATEVSRTYDADRTTLDTQITATWRKGVLAKV